MGVALMGAQPLDEALAGGGGHCDHSRKRPVPPGSGRACGCIPGTSSQRRGARPPGERRRQESRGGAARRNLRGRRWHAGEQRGTGAAVLSGFRPGGTDSRELALAGELDGAWTRLAGRTRDGIARIRQQPRTPRHLLLSARRARSSRASRTGTAAGPPCSRTWRSMSRSRLTTPIRRCLSRWKGTRAAAVAADSVVWAPGWNSVQSVNKFQEEIAGPLRGGDPGVRLIEPGRPRWRATVRHRFRVFGRPGEFLVVPLHHIFGSEELSRMLPRLRNWRPKPYSRAAPRGCGTLRDRSAKCSAARRCR